MLPEQTTSTDSRVSKSAIQQLLDANIISKDEVPLETGKGRKQSIVRATVGTSLDPWRDRKTYVAKPVSLT